MLWRSDNGADESPRDSVRLMSPFRRGLIKVFFSREHGGHGIFNPIHAAECDSEIVMELSSRLHKDDRFPDRYRAFGQSFNRVFEHLTGLVQSPLLTKYPSQ